MRQREFVVDVSDWVFLKVYSIKGVMHLGRRGSSIIFMLVHIKFLGDLGMLLMSWIFLQV